MNIKRTGKTIVYDSQALYKKVLCANKLALSKNVQYLYSFVMRDISMTNKDMETFCDWFFSHFHIKEVELSVFTTCLCGYFHTYPQVAMMLAKKCREMGLISIKKNIVYGK